LSDDEVPIALTATLLSPPNRVCQNLKTPGQVNKSANKRKMKCECFLPTLKKRMNKNYYSGF
jgi:hypothetical protein